ncbi:TetR family transcriptional regulator [Nocardia sp. ET3-3]|uniref:TetR family transcriptional regulator n=1 Tax=Nocardia terrae TaxID=2675851 RepID=A0A7K1UWA2_9NOCA|nr:TetR/AcrR family transcriptional regulator [Nocardia terrae]MVU78587.1 TetR family transcriptional regulator [Nocardia terrae]
MTTARRTQAERRATTIAKLVDATIEAIAEIGYHNASLGEISSRAGVSKGAVFRHFESRTDLVVAAADEVRRRHMAAAAELRNADNTTQQVDLEAVMRLIRREIRDTTNTVWFELLVAARTEPDLRTRLEPVLRDMMREIEDLAITILGPDISPDVARLLVTSLIHMFDGEAIIRHTYPRPELEEARIEQVAAAFRQLTVGRNGIAAAPSESRAGKA